MANPDTMKLDGRCKYSSEPIEGIFGLGTRPQTAELAGTFRPPVARTSIIEGRTSCSRLPSLFESHATEIASFCNIYLSSCRNI